MKIHFHNISLFSLKKKHFIDIEGDVEKTQWAITIPSVNQRQKMLIVSAGSCHIAHSGTIINRLRLPILKIRNSAS